MISADLNTILPELLLSVYAMLALLGAVYTGKDKLAPALVWLTAAVMAILALLIGTAGSGTTAHAVLNMNKADGGHRKFILVEMMDYADSITAERTRELMMTVERAMANDKELALYLHELMIWEVDEKRG